MVNDKKRCPIKDTKSIKISFIHYRNYITWTRVKWTVAFEEFDMVYLFWLLFSFHHHCQSLSICKRSTLAKIWGGAAPPPPSPLVSMGLKDICIYLFQNTSLKFLKNLVTIRMNEIFSCLFCYSQKLILFLRKLRQR